MMKKCLLILLVVIMQCFSMSAYALTSQQLQSRLENDPQIRSLKNNLDMMVTVISEDNEGFVIFLNFVYPIDTQKLYTIRDNTAKKVCTILEKSSKSKERLQNINSYISVVPVTLSPNRKWIAHTGLGVYWTEEGKRTMNLDAAGYQKIIDQFINNKQ